jgi:hypothetical protein
MKHKNLKKHNQINDQREPAVSYIWIKITDHFRGIYRVYYPNLIKENRRMSTCNRLDLQPLGSQPAMPKNLPDHWTRLINQFVFWNETVIEPQDEERRIGVRIMRRSLRPSTQIATSPVRKLQLIKKFAALLLSVEYSSCGDKDPQQSDLFPPQRGSGHENPYSFLHFPNPERCTIYFSSAVVQSVPHPPSDWAD